MVSSDNAQTAASFENAEVDRIGANNVNFSERDVSASGWELPGRNEWRNSNRCQPNKGDRSRIIDTCFNGGALCGFNWLIKYSNYLMDTNQRTKIDKTIGGSMRFSFWDQELREPTHASAIPIWAATDSEPANVRLITGDTGILLGLEAIAKLDLKGDFKRRKPQAG